MTNKIKYGLKNVHYSKITDDGVGNVTYATPVAWKGAVNLSLEAQGEQTPFYADNVQYWVSNGNNGYQGDFESALIPDDFRTDILGETLDEKGMYVEKANAKTEEFALMFQFEGDKSATRHVLYRCVATRPSVSGATSEDSITPQTETIQITAMPRIADDVVKARCPYSASTTSSYATWFDAVVEPTVEAD